MRSVKHVTLMTALCLFETVDEPSYLVRSVECSLMRISLDPVLRCMTMQAWAGHEYVQAWSIESVRL